MLVVKDIVKELFLYILYVADIDYAVAEAHTTYGRLGVKVWICRGEIIPTKETKADSSTEKKGE